MKRIRFLLFSCLFPLLYACAASAPEPVPVTDVTAAAEAVELAAAVPPASPQESVEEVEEIEYRNFTKDQLYAALVSELSGQRGDLEGAADSYFDLAFDTRDINVIMRAIQIASYGGDTNAVLQLGLLWAEIMPEAVDPHMMLSYQFLESSRFDEALTHMSRVIELGGRIDFGNLSSRTVNLSATERSQLIETLRQLHTRYPAQDSIQFAVIELLDQNQQSALALEELQLLKDAIGPTATTAMIEAQLLQSLGHEEDALTVLRQAVSDYPENSAVRVNLARLLLQDQEFAEARAQFQTLLEMNPRDFETLYSIALLDVEMENYDQARQVFNRLLNVNHRTDESHYYLGVVSGEQGRVNEAISHYERVQMGTNNFLAAQQQATELLVANGRLEEAAQRLSRLAQGQPRLEALFVRLEAGTLLQHDYLQEAETLLSEALDKYPNDPDILFSRVFLYDRLGDLAGAERDLRQIISLRPDDPAALNHLGYMLADRTERYSEALDLVERAIALSPEDPAIIDSLGWAQYKLGDYDAALANLRRAFAAFPDHEVASHLGEVLWVMGERREATRVWEEALEEQPDSELLKEVMERFDP
ncbi:MAG: tetratricopeptide repeat protein [Pseudohongiellaceae bacterium]